MLAAHGTIEERWERRDGVLSGGKGIPGGLNEKGSRESEERKVVEQELPQLTLPKAEVQAICLRLRLFGVRFL